MVLLRWDFFFNLGIEMPKNKFIYKNIQSQENNIIKHVFNDSINFGRSSQDMNQSKITEFA